LSVSDTDFGLSGLKKLQYAASDELLTKYRVISIRARKLPSDDQLCMANFARACRSRQGDQAFINGILLVLAIDARGARLSELLQFTDSTIRHVVWMVLRLWLTSRACCESASHHTALLPSAPNKAPRTSTKAAPYSG